MEAKRLRGMLVAREPATLRRPQPRVPRFPKCRAVCVATARVLRFILHGVLVFLLWRMLLRPALRVVRLLWRSITLCRLFGVPVQMHTTALLYPGCVFVVVMSAGRRADGFTLALCYLGIFWFSLLIHEFAHILVARRCGIGTERMVFHPFGAVALLRDMPRMGREFWIAIAGPLGSVALAGIFAFIAWKMRHDAYGLSHIVPRDYRWIYLLTRLCRDAVALNLAIALFNMIPIFPMDGARVLRSLLALGLARFTRRNRDEALRTATKILVRCVAWPLVLCVVGYILSRFFVADERILGLVMLPDLLAAALMLLVGELEYGVLCEEDDEEEKEAVADA